VLAHAFDPGEGTGGERREYILGKTRKGLRGKGSRLNKAQLHTKRQKRAFEKESENETVTAKQLL